MNPNPLDHPNVLLRGIQTLHGLHLRFPDFEVSWAGEYPPSGGLCFGSEDGRLRFADRDGRNGWLLDWIADSGEAINGVASVGRMMAVSTRSDVAFLDLNPHERGGESPKIYEGGAHGVIATAAGGFVAPLGPDGLLSMMPAYGSAHPMRVSKFPGREINLVKLTRLSGDAQADYFGGAARRDGLLAVHMGEGGPIGSRYFTAPDLDIVDVCSMPSQEWPFAAVGLGADRSFHFCRNLPAEGPVWTLSFGALRGAAYTILHALGNLFLLTSEALYAFPGLACRFLEDDALNNPVRAHIWPIEAVDISLAHDQLFVVMPDRVIVVPVEELVEISGAAPSVDTSSTSIKIPWNPPREGELLTAPAA